MNAATFLKQFEHLSEAPNGIPKLRELILQLAVRGKLVPQDPNDEPASELLKKIQVEKQRLIAEGAIRKPKPLPPIKAESAPHFVPSSWLWIRLGECIDLVSGQHLRPAEQNSEGVGIPYLTGPAEFGDTSPEPTRWTTETRVVVHSGDILLTVKGSGVGKTNVVDVPDLAISRQLMALRCIRVDRSYTVGFLKAKYDEFQALKLGIAIPGIGRNDVLGFAFPLPPAAEQKRIVAKVDELMALCDDLEAKQQAKRTKQIALNRASLHALTESNGSSLTAAWHRVRDHFDDLYTVPDTVADLRQIILQLAVMGRLVPQDPNDEPASELLKKIQAEKERLIAEGTIRKPKPLPPIELGDEPHPVPTSWRWVRLSEICVRIADTDHKMPKAVESGGYPYVSARDLLDDGTIDIAGAKRISEEDFNRLGQKVIPRRHDIVYSRIGTVGKARLVAIDESFLTSYSCCVIRPIQAAMVEQLLVHLLESALVLDQAKRGTTGIGVPDLGLNTIRSFMIPLAPMEEQKRIVAKVGQLMTLSADLEAKLQQAQTDADNLLASIVQELVEAGSGVSSE